MLKKTLFNANNSRNNYIILLKSLSTSSKETNSTYSNTLLLPQTSFQLKANAIKREPLFRDRCTIDLYEWQLENNPKELFILHDGPPYANGNLHI
ncbi:22672_t:CDS:2, partial [Entrophospora sp. SA101]